jgi:hypothetical protein
MEPCLCSLVYDIRNNQMQMLVFGVFILAVAYSQQSKNTNTHMHVLKNEFEFLRVPEIA